MSLNNFFDKIFCINLEKRKDRKDKCKNHFDSIGIEVEFFNAIDGSKINNQYRGLNNGEIGCRLSHIEIYKIAESTGLKNYLIIEDDCEFDKNINLKFPEYLKEVPSDWNLLYFGGNHNSTNINMVTPHVHRLSKTYTTHCYGVREGFNKNLLKEFELFNSAKQIDVELSDIQKKYPCYGFIPPLAWQFDGFSDIVGEYRNYEFLKTHGDPARK